MEMESIRLLVRSQDKIELVMEQHNLVIKLQSASSRMEFLGRILRSSDCN